MVRHLEETVGTKDDRGSRVFNRLCIKVKQSQKRNIYLFSAHSWSYVLLVDINYNL